MMESLGDDEAVASLSRQSTHRNSAEQRQQKLTEQDRTLLFQTMLPQHYATPVRFVALVRDDAAAAAAPPSLPHLVLRPVRKRIHGRGKTFRGSMELRKNFQTRERRSNFERWRQVMGSRNVHSLTHSHTQSVRRKSHKIYLWVSTPCNGLIESLLVAVVILAAVIDVHPSTICTMTSPFCQRLHGP